MTRRPSSSGCQSRPRSCALGSPLPGSPPGPASHTAWDGTRNCTVESPPRRSARSPASRPFVPPGLVPSVFPAAASSRRSSVCTAALPAADSTGLPSGLPEYPPETSLPPSLRRLRSSPDQSRLPPGSPSPASMLPTVRHSCRSGHTAHGSDVPYSAWHTHIACVGVLALFHRGCWVFRPCPRAYLLPSLIEAGLLPSRVFPLLPWYYVPLGPPPGSARFQPSALYARSLPDAGCQVGSLLFRFPL